MTYATIAQDIINAINGKVEGTQALANERTLESHFNAIDRFEQSINVLAMNNLGDRYHEVENEDSTTKRVWNRGRATADKRELWNGRIQYTMYRSESAKYEQRKAPATATIKASIKNLPDRTIGNKSVSDKEFKPSLGNISTYKVVNYHFYKKAIVLDLVDADEIRTTYLKRESQDDSPEIIHLVFRYMPFDRTGKPNRFDGITQLRDFLHSQKFIVSQNPASLRDALNILVGYTVNFPSFFSINLTGADDSHIITKNGEHKTFKRNRSNSDLMTVYSVYGDFTDYEREFSEKDTSEYQNISDFESSDSDSFEYEDLQQVIFNPSSNDKLKDIIKYECHKEFTESLPLRYSHVSAIFD